MYRIELSPGEETVFRTIEELAVAIRRGVVTPRARIYHNAGNKWLPIQFHPHYKTAATMPLTQAALVAGAPLKPLSSLTLDQPSEPELVAPPPATAEVARKSPVERHGPKTKTTAAKTAAKRTRRTSTKPRRQLRIALVGALLIGGAQWVLSAPLFSRADAPELVRVHRQLISSPTEAMHRVSSPNSAGMMPVMGSSPRPGASTPLEELATETGTGVPSFGGTDSLRSSLVDSMGPKVIQTIPQAGTSGTPDSSRQRPSP